MPTTALKICLLNRLESRPLLFLQRALNPVERRSQQHGHVMEEWSIVLQLSRGGSNRNAKCSYVCDKAGVTIESTEWRTPTLASRFAWLA